MKRELTANDMTEEGNRNYEMGLRHAREELRETDIEPLRQALQSLYLSSVALRYRIHKEAPLIEFLGDYETQTRAMEAASRVLKDTGAKYEPKTKSEIQTAGQN